MKEKCYHSGSRFLSLKRAGFNHSTQKLYRKSKLFQGHSFHRSSKALCPFFSVQSCNFSSEPFYGSPRSSTAPSLTSLQKLILATHSATTVFSNPERGDALASLGEVTGHLALVSMHDKMMADPVGQLILSERPTVNKNSIDIEGLLRSYKHSNESNSTKDGSKKKATFGQMYAKFMDLHGFDPDERSQVKYISNPELAYVMLRYRQCHDFWHALCDLPPTVLGELALKWIELIQTGLPVAALSATVGPLRLNSREKEILWNVYFPWAIKVGTEATFLMNVYYEKEFDEDIDSLRARLGIVAAPKIILRERSR